MRNHITYHCKRCPLMKEVMKQRRRLMHLAVSYVFISVISAGTVFALVRMFGW
jgi:hypothetical protein